MVTMFNNIIIISNALLLVCLLLSLLLESSFVVVYGFIHLHPNSIQQDKNGSCNKNNNAYFTHHDRKRETTVVLPKTILVLEKQQQEDRTSSPQGSNRRNKIIRTPILLVRKRWNRLLDSTSQRRQGKRSQKSWEGPLWNRRLRIQKPLEQQEEKEESLDDVASSNSSLVYTTQKQRRRRSSRIVTTAPASPLSKNNAIKDYTLLDDPCVEVSEEKKEEEEETTTQLATEEEDDDEYRIYQPSSSSIRLQQQLNSRTKRSYYVENTPRQHQHPGKRVQFTAQHTSKRSLENLDESLLTLLHEYMTQPVEQYSLLSFHEQHDLTNNKTVEATTNTNTTVQSRRWLVRRLTTEEAEFYNNVGRNGGHREQQSAPPDSFFRLAVPLMPLVGLDLTPVIDLSVDVINNNNNNNTQYDNNDTNTQQLHNKGRWWIRRDTMESIPMVLAGGKKRQQQHDQVRVRSVRVALLSTEAEVTLAMKGNGNRKNHHHHPKHSSSSSSSDNNIKLRMGYEAIGMAGSLEKIIQPHVSFKSVISWSPSSSSTDTTTNDKPFIKVKTEVATSLSIPPLPLPLFPSSLVVANIGSLLTKKALSLVLPHFLKKLELDFCRWANADASSTTATTSDMESLPAIESISKDK